MCNCVGKINSDFIVERVMRATENGQGKQKQKPQNMSTTRLEFRQNGGNCFSTLIKVIQIVKQLVNLPQCVDPRELLLFVQNWTLMCRILVCRRSSRNRATTRNKTPTRTPFPPPKWQQFWCGVLGDWNAKIGCFAGYSREYHKCFTICQRNLVRIQRMIDLILTIF